MSGDVTAKGKTTMDDLVAYDFSLDNIVSVKAPKGVDPATLHEQLRVRLQEILDEADESFIFEGNFTGDE